jgi:hypothetical protein
MRYLRCGLVTLGCTAWATGLAGETVEPKILSAAIQQIKEGDFEAGLVTIDDAIRQLEGSAQQSRDLLARAYLYQGVALLELEQADLARTKLLRAAELDSRRQLDPTEFSARVIRAFERARQEVLARGKRSGKTVPLLVAGGAAAAGLGVALAVKGSKSADPTVDLRLNGQHGGSFSCTSGLFFTISVTNPGDALPIERFSLNFTALSPQCQSHDAPVDGLVGRTVAAGATEEARRIDLAGDLCRTSGHSPGCQWRASVLVTTGAGTLGDQLEFSTTP